MNILIDTLPDSVEIGGWEYPIRTDFRDCLRVLIAFEDPMLTPQEKHLVVLANVYYEVPDDTAEALNAAMWFLDGGREGEQTEGDGIRLFSWNKDANLIFAAFRQTHGVDLNAVDMHWWKFLALFMDLGQDTTFCQLTALRSRVKNGKADKSEREMAASMGEAFDVPDDEYLEIEEREAKDKFMKLLKEGKHGAE